MDKHTKREMREFDKSIGGYTPDDEIWNAIAFLDESAYGDSVEGARTGYKYLNGLYRGILVGANGAWSKKAKHALWEEMQKFSILAAGGEAAVAEQRIMDTIRQFEDANARVSSYQQEAAKLKKRLEGLMAKK